MRYYGRGKPIKEKVLRAAAISDKETKARYILNAFTPGEIQAYTKISVPHKVGRKFDSLILMRTEFTPGTGIPASTIKRFQDGTYKKMGPVTIKKLSIMYDKYQRVNLRSVGASKNDARRFCKWTPVQLNKILRNYYTNALQIQKNYKQQGINKVLCYIQWGMAHSKHSFSEWNRIAALSGLAKLKPPRKRRKKGYGSHRE